MTLSLATITVSLLLRDDPEGPATQPKPKAPPFGDELQTLVNWLSFVAILACVVGVVVTGARMAIAWRGGGEANVAQLGWVLFGCILIGTAASLVNSFV